jgi:metal-responsive CopG/Arc/MetJ family transcriptional regulator
LNLSEFLTILENDEEKYQDGVDKIYNDIGSYIADILLYIKRVYSLDIDNFYIDSDGKLNDVFFKYIGSYIDLTPQRFDFDCKFVGEPITHLSKLALLDASFYSNDNINFSVFEKEKAFIYKDSGRLILTTLASLLIAFLYPIFNYSYAYIVDIQKSNESELLLKHESVENEYRLLFRALDSKKQEFIHRKERVQNEIKSVKDLMIKIKNKKSKYRLKIAKIVEVLKSFNNFSIKSMNLNIDGNEILTIYTISKDEEEITKFVKEINSIYDVDVKKISFDKSEYISEIKIKELK